MTQGVPRWDVHLDRKWKVEKLYCFSPAEREPCARDWVAFDKNTNPISRENYPDALVCIKRHEGKPMDIIVSAIDELGAFTAVQKILEQAKGEGQ